jgi:hypothetical protein
MYKSYKRKEGNLNLNQTALFYHSNSQHAATTDLFYCRRATTKDFVVNLQISARDQTATSPEYIRSFGTQAILHDPVSGVAP